MNQLFLKDSRKMDDVADGSVNLVVTSPPYYNAIDYGIHVTGGGQDNYRTRQTMSYSAYLQVMVHEHMAECYRVLAPGGFGCFVLGTVLEKGRHLPLPFELLHNMQQLGWEFHQDIVWHKVTGGVKRAGVTIQHPFPGYYYPNIMTEYIIVMRKPGIPIYTGRTDQQENRIAIDDLFKKEVANNVWHIAPVPPNQYNHPCPFPEEIPRRLIRLYSYIGDTVLDPFNGIGTTTKVAAAMGRNYVGYELIPEYHKIASERLAEAMVVRKQLYPEWNHIKEAENG